MRGARGGDGAAVAPRARGLVARGSSRRRGAHRCRENMCFSCSSGPRSTAKLAIESMEPRVKKRQNFCGRSSTSGRKAPASTNMHTLSMSSATKCFQRWREAKGMFSPKLERKGIVLALLCLPPRPKLLPPRVQSKEKPPFSLDGSSGWDNSGVCCGVCQRAWTPGQTRRSDGELHDIAAPPTPPRGESARARAWRRTPQLCTRSWHEEGRPACGVICSHQATLCQATCRHEPTFEGCLGRPNSHLERTDNFPKTASPAQYCRVACHQSLERSPE